MRLALIADVHANLPALEAVWEDIEQRGVDEVICLGDLVGYYPWPNEVVEFIRSKNIPSLQGNYDQSAGEELPACGCDFANEEAAGLGEISLSWTINAVTEDNKAWLRSLPKDLRLCRAGYGIWAVHGSPRRNNEYLTTDFPAADLAGFLHDGNTNILLCAHTHLAYHRQIGQGHVINAGSAGKPKHGNPNVTYVILNLAPRVSISVIEVPYDHEKTAKATLAAGLPASFAATVRTGNA